jgi:hypothetical protein
MTVANTLAYYEMSTITAVKSFIVLTRGECTIKLSKAVVVAIS